MKQIAIGAVHQEEVMPRASDLASAIGNDGVDVVSSPATIGFLEMASHNLIKDCFEGDEASVGTGFEFRHVAAAMPGKPLQVKAELLAINKARYQFKVSASQADKLIMEGRHERAVINLGRFLPDGSATTAKPVDFWFDIHSPWAYLAALRLPSLMQRVGRVINWRPLHLPTLQTAINGRQPLEENAAFVNWYKQDLQDHAQLQGVEIRYHPDFPLRNSRALRASLAAIDQGAPAAFILRLMQGYWSESADITSLDVLAGFANEVGLDGDVIANAAVDDGYKQRLLENTLAAQKRGVFGVPTLDADGKLYFGNDRLELFERHAMAGKV